MKRARTAFTLVELLVVIGIIALLISILLPAVTRAKAQAMRVACASNLRAQGQGLAVYIHDTKYYPGHANSEGGVIYAVWPTRIRKALGGKSGTGIFWCPANEPGFQWQTSGSPASTQNDQGFGYFPGERRIDVFNTPFSYGYNDWGFARQQAPPSGIEQRGLGGDLWGGFSERKAAKVKKPSEMIAIADNTSDGAWDLNIDPRFQDKSEWPGKIHNNGANVLFCDGHVEWFAQKELVEFNGVGTLSQRMQRMWNADNQVYNE